MSDKGRVSIAGAYHAAQSQLAQAASSTAVQISSSAAAAAGSPGQTGVTDACPPALVSSQFNSREEYMAALCRQVAVNGFKPMANVFSLKEW